jgi:hypothetical protein
MLSERECRESESITVYDVALRGIAELSATYSIQLVLLPEKKTETTSSSRSTRDGIISYTKEFKFTRAKFSNLDSYEMMARLMKKMDGTKCEVECAFTQFQLDFLFVLRAATLKFALEEIDCPLQSRGELEISLSYLPTAQRVTAVSIKAKNLKAANSKHCT